MVKGLVVGVWQFGLTFEGGNRCLLCSLGLSLKLETPLVSQKPVAHDYVYMWCNVNWLTLVQLLSFILPYYCSNVISGLTSECVKVGEIGPGLNQKGWPL